MADRKERKERVNREIKARRVMAIGEDGARIGVMPLADALAAAEGAGLDLIEVAPSADPPVCRIGDYGKYRYEKAKKEKAGRPRGGEVKEVRMRPGTDRHDMLTKAAAARKFLERGDRVKATVRFRGREAARPEAGEEALREFAEAVGCAVMAAPPKKEGRSMSAMLVRKA